MEAYRNILKNTTRQLLIDLNEIVVLNLNGYLTDDYSDYKTELMGQKDAIEMLLDTADIYYDRVPNLYNKLELIGDILSAEDEDNNQLEVIDLALTYIEDRATNPVKEVEVHLSDETYSVLEGCIVDFIADDFLCDEDTDKIYHRLENIALSSNILKAYTAEGVAKVNSVVNEIIHGTSYADLNKDSLKKYINVISNNKVSAEVYGCDDKVINDTNKLLNELEDILNNLC